MHYNIVVFGTKDTTFEMIRYINETLQKRVDLLITVSQKVVEQNDIAGYANIGDQVKQYNIHIFSTNSYSLCDENCNLFFSANTFDIGISMGWQRLIPRSVLTRFNFGVYGFHGSCGYLPFGRGRSPLNWSLLLGDRRFILNLFQYDEKADSPNVFRNTMFEINAFDTIRTLQYKNTICAKNLVKELLDAYESKSISVRTESVDFDSWYKKRSPEDGKIDFKKRTREIYNLIRSVSDPFAGAYCFLKNKKMIIWDATPFDSFIDFSRYAVGEIIDIFDGKPIIRTLDGSLLIKKFEYNGDVKTHEIME